MNTATDLSVRLRLAAITPGSLARRSVSAEPAVIQNHHTGLPVLSRASTRSLVALILGLGTWFTQSSAIAAPKAEPTLQTDSLQSAAPQENTNTASPCQTSSTSETRRPVKPIAHSGVLLFETEDGRHFSLAGLSLPMGIAHTLASLEASNIRLFLGESAGSQNRWGITPAWIRDANGTSAQERLLREGLALVDHRTVSGPCKAALFQAEAIARARKTGLWTSIFPLPARKPDTLLNHVGRLIVIEGYVYSLGKTEKTLYLNFGRDWKSDATATIARKHEGLFSGALAGIDEAMAQGRSVRVRLRGVLQEWDGPTLELSAPEQLQITDLERN